VIHVHEIPSGIARRAIRILLAFSRAKVLHNSKATFENLSLPANMQQKVVHNGVDCAGPDANFRTHNETLAPHRKSMASTGAGGGRMRILMIGRLNSWKGQDLLLDSLARLSSETREDLHVVIKGDVFENAPYRDQLQDQIQKSGLQKIVELHSFDSNPSAAYDWCDLVVVPSRKPEPFGLIAIEAMAQGKPVLAAKHGGLLEIIVENSTGWFHKPNDSQDLAEQISWILRHRNDLTRIGEAGRKRYLRTYTLESFEKRFLKAIG